MRFVIDSGELSAAVARVAAGLPAHPQKPVYGGILATIGTGLALTASDGDITFTADAELLDDAYDQGKLIFPRVITEMTRYLPEGAVQVSCDGTTAQLTAGKSSFTLPVMDGGDFPFAEPGETESPDEKLDAEEFAAAVKRVLPAASESEPHLDSVMLVTGGGMETGSVPDGRLTLIATNRYKMAVTSAEFGGTVPDEILVPAKVIGRFARSATGTANLTWDSSLVSMRADGLRVITRRYEAKYPDWRKVMSRAPRDWFGIPCDDVIRAVRAAALVAPRTAHLDPSIWLEFSADGLRVSAGGEKGSCAGLIPCEPAVRLTTLAGAQMLLDGLTGEMAVLEGKRPVLWFRDGDYRYMLQSRQEV